MEQYGGQGVAINLEMVVMREYTAGILYEGMPALSFRIGRNKYIYLCDICFKRKQNLNTMSLFRENLQKERHKLRRKN